MSRRHGPRPQAIWWWVFLSFFLALLPLIGAGLSFWGLWMAESMQLEDGDWEGSGEDEMVAKGIMWSLIVGGVVASLIFAVGPFLPRTRATWVYGIIQMILPALCGFYGMCLLAFTIPMLVFWCRKEVRQWVENKPTGDLVDVFD